MGKKKKSADIIDARQETDTLKLWENYREQALLWRTIALAQLFFTAFVLIACMVFYMKQEIVLNVPAKPLPGQYAAQEIPDTEYVNAATDFVNLIATYQSNIARRQFNRAVEMLHSDRVAKFDEEMMGTELRAIENTRRTQIFYVDPLKIQVLRGRGRTVTVSMQGDRQKIVAGKELQAIRSQYDITMTTVPKHKHNPYGIVITELTLRNV